MDKISSANWLGTYNNPPEDFDGREFLESMHNLGQTNYVCGQMERGKQEGTLHLQFFVNLTRSQKLSYVRKMCKDCHWEIVRINNGADNYCLKEDTRVDGPWMFGKKPMHKNNRHDWEEVKKSAEKGDWENVPAEIYIRHYNNLKKIEAQHLVATDYPNVRGIWLYGPPGSGKTTRARVAYGSDVYFKA